MVKKGVGADSSHLLGLGWCGNGLGSNNAVVDVRDGKILRTRNFDFSEGYAPEDRNAWKLIVGDKTFEGPMVMPLPPASMPTAGYRSTPTPTWRCSSPSRTCGSPRGSTTATTSRRTPSASTGSSTR